MHYLSKFAAAKITFSITLLCSLLLNLQTTSGSHILETFADNNGGKFKHLTVDHFRGWVYVGGINHIYQLNQSLKLFSNITNGPVDDAPECSFFSCPPGTSKKPTDNHNKALVIDYSTNRLIICGSTLQGMCTIHSRENISMVLQEVKEAVVANDANASTVAFIAQGPSQSSSSPSLVLYVGATFTGNYFISVPAVASRSLDRDRMLTIASVGITTSTQIFIDSLSRGSYIINYIFGFSSGSFSYFLTTQINSSTSTSPYISKLVRVCHDDQDYYSYIEIPIECKVEGGRSYNLAQAAFVGKPGLELAQQLNNSVMDDVLFVIFSQSETNGGERANKPSKHCALCIYSLSMIKHQFKVNIKNCFMGLGSYGGDHITASRKCIHTSISITEDFCGMDVNSPIDGKTPVTATPVQTFNTQLTSVAATYTGNHTVVFVGTRNGQLKKLVVESSTQAVEYSDLVIDEGSAVNPDMILDADKNYLYVMTERRITKVKVQDCDEYDSCWQCLNAKDPYCGWCLLENKCSLRSKCQDAARYPLSWIPYKPGKCPSISSVTPGEIRYSTPRTIELTIDNLPPLNGQFLCVFSILNETLITNATLKNRSVNCTTPLTDLLPPIPPGRHDLIATLSMKMINSSEFVDTNFTFFDCNSFTSCTSCVSSNFPCDWCVHGHRCAHDTAENCLNNIHVTDVNHGDGGPSGPTFCPLINTTSVGSTEILIAAGTEKGIRVKIYNIDQFPVDTRFLCQFNIEGRLINVSANLVDDTIHCQDMEFQYTQEVPNMTVTFAVIWGDSELLDNPEDIHVVIYRCHDMANHCGMCLLLDKKYNCGWCQSTNSCEIVNQCDDGSKNWLDQNHTCPNPSITSFSPQLGPWEGGTNVTIEGIDLGRSYADVNGGITVCGITCEPYRYLYKPTREIVCRMNGSGTPEPREGSVIVKIDEFQAESKDLYQFVDPKIESIFPRLGPRAGGTLLTVRGEYMNAGSNIEVFVDELPCHTVKIDQNEVQCITSLSDHQREGNIKVKFDQVVRLYDKERYEYTADPTIEQLQSGIGFNKTLKGIPAGGINISVTGKHLLSIEKPRFYVYDEKKTHRYFSKCEVHSDSGMTCLSPYMPDIDSSMLDPDFPLQLHYGFEMDNVTSVQNISMKPGFPMFLLYPNPTFDTFPEIKVYGDEYLIITGQNIDSACQGLDVVVQIGVSFCNVTSLSKYQLLCRLPKTRPSGAANGSEGENHTDLLEVVVYIGDNIRIKIGELRYPWQQQYMSLLETILYGGILGIIILIFVFVTLLFAYRRKSTESSRVRKNVEKQMDIIQLQVAAECKEAFAELQTEMTDFTTDITSGGIPFLDYRSYATKILFPNLEDPSLILREKPELVRKEKGLRLFGQLVMNKTFLLLFIHTLESDPLFSMEDRVNVAAMIMITLQSNMVYCTNILKTLLAKLIEKSLESKRHPKLLLRRTESVAEKMLSVWFPFLLYKFLRECAGEPLYMLFHAIKQHVNKGPVDAITSEARYSLSEEKLIRESIDYRAMAVHVSMSQQTAFGLNSNTENMQVKVLDCDTISQVKEKALDTIYRATPYSQRPCPSKLNVEWRMGISGRLILNDDDTTSKVENKWKKKNTLNHYRVPDGGLLNLVSVEQTSNYNISTVSADKTREKLPTYETSNFAKCNTANPPHLTTAPLTQDNDYRVWHLVKQRDSNENQKKGDRSNKMVSEIYLTRLLATKSMLQKFVDDLFETIFSTAHRGSALPLAIKYMFDFLDDQALFHGITDPEVVHSWKSNCLPLRFWVNVIKNPNFVFDIHKSNIVDSCLSVVAQTFMDSCSTSEQHLSKFSPSSKLLYAKDIPLYKKRVERYYSDIKMMPAISEEDMNAVLAEESRLHTSEFNTDSSLYELYMYAVKYKKQLTVTLEEDEFSQIQKLAFKLVQVQYIMGADLNP